MSLAVDRIKKIRPLHDRVLLQRISDEESKTPGGIFIPEQAKEKAQIGIVIAIGSGKISQNGSLQPLLVKVGDHVFFGKYAGTEIGGDFVIVREEEIFGIL